MSAHPHPISQAIVYNVLCIDQDPKVQRDTRSTTAGEGARGSGLSIKVISRVNAVRPAVRCIAWSDVVAQYPAKQP